LFNWGGRKNAPSSSTSSTLAAAESGSDPAALSKVLPKVFSALANSSAPTIMDLGPVVGANISFFGEELACKILVEDLFAVVESHARAGTRELLADALVTRMAREPGSADGILCWDLFDYLDKSSSKALAAALTTLLRPGGVLYAFFGSKPANLEHYTRYTVEARDRLRTRSVPATPTARNVLVTRDINRMFEGLIVGESVLLKSNARETLFRKPA
jgi:hypothetical protein